MNARYRVHYVQSAVDLARHWKVEALAAAVGTSVPAALGHLHLLWWFTANASCDAQATGDLSRFDASIIERQCQWTGAAGALVDGLLCTGWLDRDNEGGLHTHDWRDHSGRGVAAMNARAAKMREWRAARSRSDARDATVPLRDATVPSRDVTVTPKRESEREREISPPSGEASASPPPLARHASSLHPAVQVVRETLGVSPVGAVRDAIVEAISSPTDADLERLREACGAWRLRGHNPRNVAGVLDWYREGVPSLVRPTVRGSSTPTRESPASRMRALGETLKELEVANGANRSGAFGRGRDVGLLAGSVPTAGRGSGGSGSSGARVLGSGSGA